VNGTVARREKIFGDITGQFGKRRLRQSFEPDLRSVKFNRAAIVTAQSLQTVQPDPFTYALTGSNPSSTPE